MARILIKILADRPSTGVLSTSESAGCLRLSRHSNRMQSEDRVLALRLNRRHPSDTNALPNLGVKDLWTYKELWTYKYQ